MKLRPSIVIWVAVVIVSMLPVSVLADSSENFYEEDGQVFDEWDVCRTRCAGQDGFLQVMPGTGFRPVIAFESLGENAHRAYQLGLEFAEDYPDLRQRAEKIFVFARDRIRYSSDTDQFGFGEFAQNADEVAATIEEEGFACGDCEDYAFLLAVMYKGAGCRSAIVLAPGHAAALVYLPKYNRANRSLSIDGESGWVWAEATGGNNPLGWMPEQYMGDQLAAYEVGGEAITLLEPPGKPSTIVVQKGADTRIYLAPFFGMIALLWVLPLFRRRR